MAIVPNTFLADKAATFQISKIPHHVLRDVIEFMVENNKAKDAATARANLYMYTSREIFDMYLTWNGIIHWTDSILQAIDGIRAAERG